MNHVRYLTPFVIFLSLFCVSGAMTYYFYNQKIKLEQETEAINQQVLQKLGRIHTAAEIQRGELVQIAGNTAKGGTIGYTSNKPFTKTAELNSADYIKDLREINGWIRGQADRLRKVTHIKSQHQVDFAGNSALEPNAQLATAKTLLKKADDEVEPSIQFVTEIDPNKPGSGVIAARDILNPEDAERYNKLREKLRQQRSDIKSRINEITGALKAIEDIPEAKRKTPENLTVIRAQYAKASAQCYRLLELLTYATIDGKKEAIPGLIDSPAKHAAMQLYFYLTPNELEAIRRSAPTDDGMPGDPNNAGDISFRTLTDDYFRLPSERAFATAQVYLSGVSLEDVVDNQSTLIDSLLRLNHLLVDQYVLELATNHPSGPKYLLNGTPDRKWRGTTTDINAVDGENNTRNRNVGEKVEGWKKESDEMVSSIGTDKTAIDDAKLGLESFFSKEKEAVLQRIEADQNDAKRLQALFYKYKQEGQRQEGTLKLRGADGKILWLDNADKVYHIDLGRSDNIRKGMRFVVFSDIGGVTEEKALIEIVQIPRDTYSVCKLIVQYPGTREILVGDKIENRLYHNRHNLRVACIGEFKAPKVAFTQQVIEQFLRELGCEVQDEPNVNTQLVILAEPAEQFVPFDDRIKRYLELRQRTKLDEILADDLMIYFEDQ